MLSNIYSLNSIGHENVILHVKVPESFLLPRIADSVIYYVHIF